MDLTFDGQEVALRGGLSGDGVVSLTRVRAGVLVERHVDQVSGRLDVGQRVVKLPGEDGGGDGGGGAVQRHFAVDLDGLLARDGRLLRTVWGGNRAGGREGLTSGPDVRRHESSTNTHS